MMKSFVRFVIGSAIAAWTAFALGEKAILAFAPPSARAALGGEVPTRAEPVEPAVVRVEAAPPSRKASESLDEFILGIGNVVRSGQAQAITAIVVAALLSLMVGYKSRPTIDRRKESREVRAAQRRQLQREQDMRLLAQAAARSNPSTPVGAGNAPGSQGKRHN
jgi:hypothetical protein